MTRFRSTSRQIVALIVLLYLCLGVLYSLATPVLEASDEFKHYPYVQHLQTNGELPVLEPEVCRQSPDACPWLQDGGQPPAYYALLAAVTSWIDTSDLSELLWRNDHAFIGNPAQVCNKNLIIHRPTEERFPWQGAVLAIYLSRFTTIALGAGSVILTFRIARELFPGNRALALSATGLTAFNPMFIFVNASVNNDALTILLGSLTLLISLRLVRDGLREPLSLWRYALMGVTVGLFLLTKLSGLAALMLLPVLLAWVGYRRRSWRPLAVGFPVILAVAALVSGWWFLRNWQLYGDPTGLNAFIEIQGTRGGFPTLRDWVEEFVTFRWTYWGLFGGVNVRAPLAVYRFFETLSLLGIVGFATWTVRSGELRGLWLGLRRPESTNHGSLWWIPVIWGGILFVSVLRWTVISHAFQGRLIFPGIAGISTLLVAGLHHWFPRRVHSPLSLIVAATTLAIAAILPFTSILPAYAHPEPLELTDVPDDARVTPVPMGTVAQIVGWDFEGQTVTPGDGDGGVDLVVYWQAVSPDSADHISFVRLLGRDHELAGEINRHPACGMVPTSLWEPGQVWRDPYRIPVADQARAPTRLRVEAGLYNPELGETLGVAKVGEAKLAPPEAVPELENVMSVTLADGIALRGYHLSPPEATAGEALTVALRWAARDTPSRDYQVFVHLLGDGPTPVAQGDGSPLQGYYPTGMWAAGEIISDAHKIQLPVELPETHYRVAVGMYHLETMERLPRLDGGGDSIVIPTTVTVRSAQR